MACEDDRSGLLVSVCTEDPASQGQEELGRLDWLTKPRQEQGIMGQEAKWKEERLEKTDGQGAFVLGDKELASAECCLREKGPLHSVITSGICFWTSLPTTLVFLEMRLN